jgi:hypothetical protein
MEKQQYENLKAELKKIGIRTEKDLQEAIESLPPLKLWIMTGKVREAGEHG